MLLEAFGFSLKTKKPDDHLIKAFVRLKRVAELKTSEDEGESSNDDNDNEKKPDEIPKEEADQSGQETARSKSFASYNYF